VVVEQVLLPVRPDRHAEFEAAFAEATPLVAGVPGFRRLTLARCIEDDGSYLLLVEWERLEDHTVGFRGSAEYQEWRRLLHHFYDPFPTVLHFEPVAEVGTDARRSPSSGPGASI
jgi:heme-degrading monooxygenase HmoA